MKTKPIGVRFDQEILDELKKDGKASSPQKALNYLIGWYRDTKITRDIIEIVAPKNPVKKETSMKEDILSRQPPPGLTGIDLSIWKAENK